MITVISEILVRTRTDIRLNRGMFIKKFICRSKALFLIALGFPLAARGDDDASSGIWAHDNLFAWCVVPFDANKRTPEQRAQMFNDLGIKQFVYDWRDTDIPNFDAELDALQKHGITLLGWWSPGSAADPNLKLILETFKRHNVHPQLWVAGGGNLTNSAEEQKERVNQEADRINGLVKMASPYGCKVELYNHNYWYGMEDNELAILDRLKELGVTDVGMVYNFSHAHDDLHDDTTTFSAIWKRIQPHVVAVNLVGMGPWNQEIYLAQGQHEFDMMKTIQDSGWTGPVGLVAEKGGDAAVTLKNYMTGLDWLAARLKEAHIGSDRPFPEIPAPSPLVPGQFGSQAMDVSDGGVTVGSKDELRESPITVELWAKLSNANAVNVLVASDPKSSRDHWELNSRRFDGDFGAVLSGKGQEIRSHTPICDNQWHYLAMVLDLATVKLYVDGKKVADAQVESPDGDKNPGDIAIGRSVEGDDGCYGTIQDVRISKGAKDISAVPTAPLTNDDDTLELWRLDKLPHH